MMPNDRARSSSSSSYDRRPCSSRPVGAAPRRCHIGKVRKPCVWIAGFPFDLEDFDTGWEYLYDGCVYPEERGKFQETELELCSTPQSLSSVQKEAEEVKRTEEAECALWQTQKATDDTRSTWG